MVIEGIINDDVPYCVYRHLIGNIIFYVGSGTLPRAFESGPARRNEAWNRFVALNGVPCVTVEIVERVRERSVARRLEYDYIRKLRPIANLPFDASLALEWQVLPIEGSASFLATDADFGKSIRSWPSGNIWPNVEIAAAMTGVSRSAVYNSLSGRFPEVRGVRFERVPRPNPIQLA